MKYQIENASKHKKAFNTKDKGLHIIKPGKTETVTLMGKLDTVTLMMHERAGVKITEVGGGKDEPTITSPTSSQTEAPPANNPEPRPNYSEMTKEELKAALDEAGVEYADNALKADLLELTNEIE